MSTCQSLDRQTRRSSVPETRTAAIEPDAQTAPASAIPGTAYETTARTAQVNESTINPTAMWITRSSVAHALDTVPFDDESATVCLRPAGGVPRAPARCARHAEPARDGTARPSVARNRAETPAGIRPTHRSPGATANSAHAEETTGTPRRVREGAPQSTEDAGSGRHGPEGDRQAAEGRSGGCGNGLACARPSQPDIAEADRAGAQPAALREQQGSALRADEGMEAAQSRSGDRDPSRRQPPVPEQSAPPGALRGLPHAVPVDRLARGEPAHARFPHHLLPLLCDDRARSITPGSFR